MQLSNFNSVLEVSVALHLAFAFVRDVHDFHIRKLEEHVDSAADAAQSPPERCDSASLNFWISHLRWLIEERRRELKKKVLFMQLCSVAIASVSLAILVCAGISPEFSLATRDLVLLLVFTLLPMPTFCAISYFSHRAWLRHIAKARKNLQNEWTSVVAPILSKFSASVEK